MPEIRWWRLVSLMVLAVAWWGCSPAEAREGSPDPCLTDQLRTSEVTADIRFSQHHQTYIKMYSDMTIKVPMKWDLAKNLTFSDSSGDYRRAIHCLLLGKKGVASDREWRSSNPGVTAKDGLVTVRYGAYTWIDRYGIFQLGPWRVSALKKHHWEVALQPPSLDGFAWKHIGVQLDGLDFDNHSTRDVKSSDANGLEWDHEMPKDVKVDFDIPLQHSVTLVFTESFLSKAGVATWWVSASCVMALAALRSRQSYSSATQCASGQSSRTPGWRSDVIRIESPVGTVLQWAVLSTAVVVTLILVIPENSIPRKWRSLICMGAGLALLFVARPWKRGGSPVAADTEAEGAADPDDVQRRQIHAVAVAAAVATAVGLLVLLGHGLFGLPANLVPKAPPTVLGLFGLTLLGLATVWLWLAAMTAWAWRFAREGGLARTWAAAWDRAPGRCTATVGILLTGVALALLGCALWSSYRQWERANWLTGGGSFAKAPYVNQIMADFSFTDLIWVFSHSWILTVVALVALLYLRVRTQQEQARSKQEQASLWPGTPELLLIAAVFAFLVGVPGGSFAGASALYGSAWIPLNIGSLYLVLAMGRRYSVLGQLRACFHGRQLNSKKRRPELLSKAQRYRSLNHQLHLLDQGHGGSATRQQLEDELHGLHRWLVDTCGGESPPEHISVLDVALAWGPQGHWWSNAVHAARLAFCFGIPASAALVFLDLQDDRNVMQYTYQAAGIPEFVARFLLYQLAWTGAGFALGALWRLLPGHRSPVRAWSLTLASALPICLALLIIRITDAPFGHVLLYLLLMLITLALTSIWLDTATFKHEQELWSSRVALLLSIYQVRGFSTHVGWILAQVVAAVGLWHTLAHR